MNKRKKEVRERREKEEIGKQRRKRKEGERRVVSSSQVRQEIEIRREKGDRERQKKVKGGRKEEGDRERTKEDK